MLAVLACVLRLYFTAEVLRTSYRRSDRMKNSSRAWQVWAKRQPLGRVPDWARLRSVPDAPAQVCTEQEITSFPS